MRAVFYAPHPDVIWLNALNSPKEKASCAAAWRCVSEISGVRRPVNAAAVLEELSSLSCF
jgi:hypothetical protein